MVKVLSLLAQNDQEHVGKKHLQATTINRKPLLSRHKSQAGGGSGARNLVSDYLFVRSVRRASVGPSSTLGISTVAGRLYYRAANEPLRRFKIRRRVLLVKNAYKRFCI